MIDVIGLHGRKRAGKDTVAKMVGEMLGVPFKVISPADSLKLLICEALGIEYHGLSDALDRMDDCKDTWTLDIKRTEDWAPGTEGDALRISPGWKVNEVVTTLSGRQLLQNTGDGARKVFGDDFWLDQILPPANVYTVENLRQLAIKHKLDQTATLLVPSIRYENEAMRIRNYHGVNIEVVRPGNEDGDNFISERPLRRDLVDYTVVNDGSLAELRDKVYDGLTTLGLIP